MNRKLFAAMLLLVASCGCRACDNSCDYLPPVLDGPYASHGTRSGSTFANNLTNSPAIPTPAELDAITPIQE